MNIIKKTLLVLTYIVLCNSLLASEMTHEFKNPAFSGNGYSSHVLSINQLEVQRKQGVIDDLKSAAAAAERAEKNKTSCDSETTTCPTSGTSTIEGAQIAWVKDTTTEIITLTITADDGTVTTMAVPIGDFKF